MKPIKLFAGIEILPNLSKNESIEYLKKYFSVEDLDTIYIKKIGNDKTTFAIDFECDEISSVRKVQDESGNNLNEIIFQKDLNETDDEIDECHED